MDLLRHSCYMEKRKINYCIREKVSSALFALFIMQKQLKENLPSFHTENDIYTTILTNDMDSLLCSAVEKHINNWDINYFYNFESLYVLDSDNTKERVGLDLALTRGKTIDNHLMTYNSSTIHNPEAINLNYAKGINNNTYYKKFPLSTFLLLVSLHDIPLNYNDESFIKFLLSVDSSHLGYYASNAHFKKVYTHWLEEMNLTQMLDILSRTPIEEFKEIQTKNAKLGKTISLDTNGQLRFGNWNGCALEMLSNKIGFDVSLPEGQFKVLAQFRNKEFNASPRVNSFMTDEDVFSYNFTYKSCGKVSVKIN